MEDKEKQLALAAIENLILRLELMKQYLEDDKFMVASADLIPCQIRFDILKDALNQAP